MRKRSQRLWMIGAAALLVAGGLALVAVALPNTLSFFQSPSDIAKTGAGNIHQSIRVGGLVLEGSKSHDTAGKLIFKVTDGANTVPVVFDGIPPDLFEEGKGVVVEGKFDGSGTLVAARVLAKHDENYLPKETYDALKKAAGEKGKSAYEKDPTT